MCREARKKSEIEQINKNEWMKLLLTSKQYIFTVITINDNTKRAKYSRHTHTNVRINSEKNREFNNLFLAYLVFSAVLF